MLITLKRHFEIAIDLKKIIICQITIIKKFSKNKDDDMHPS